MFQPIKNSDSGKPGNERPCMECKRRGLTKTCVDGDRKIPRYLYDMSKKPPKIDLYGGRTLLNAPADSLDSWALPSNPINRFGATFEEQVDPSLNYPTEQGQNDFVDPAILHIESPILFLGQQTANSNQQPEGDLTAHSLTIEMRSRPVLPVGCHGSHGVERSFGRKTIGFTIKSGWSSTFSPCGMNEEPEGLINVSSK
jgi:hypothetical protein